jgi:hypothetical protein
VPGRPTPTARAAGDLDVMMMTLWIQVTIARGQGAPWFTWAISST